MPDSGIFSGVSELKVRRLLSTDALSAWDVLCAGNCGHRSAEEHPTHTHLVFPYRGVFVWHLARQQVIADANHVLFFNATETYRVSHPVAGGDRSFVLAPSDELLRELAPARTFVPSDPLRFRHQHHRIDARSQALAALLRHGLTSGTLEGLAAETLPVALIDRKSVV